MERILDAAIAVVSAVPGGAVPAAALATIGKGGLIVHQWQNSPAAEREQQQYEEVIWQAALSLAQGDAEIAEANVAAHANDPAFRARVHATVTRMRDGAPCDAACVPLGALIAAYQGQRPDALFRNIATLLVELSDQQLVATRKLVESLARLISGPRLAFKALSDEGGERSHIFLRQDIHPGHTAEPADVIAAGGICEIIEIMLEDGIVTADAASGVMDDPVQPDVRWIEQRTLALLARVFPVQGGSKIPFHRRVVGG